MVTDTVEEKVYITYSCLPDEISKLMREANHPDPEGWKAALPAEAFNHPDLDVQRQHINSAWRQILTDLPMDEMDKTRNARACLLDTMCQPFDYLRFFQKFVIPCAIQLGLPKQK